MGLKKIKTVILAGITIVGIASIVQDSIPTVSIALGMGCLLAFPCAIIILLNLEKIKKEGQ